MNNTLNIGIIHNPKAGTPKKQRYADDLYHRILQHFKNVNYKTTYTRGDESLIAETMCHEQIDLIIVMGGDGSIHHTVNGIMNSSQKSPYLCILPVGSGNDFSRYFNIKLNIDSHLNMLHSYSEDSKSKLHQFHETDIGIVEWDDGNKRHFANSVGMGMDSAVVQHLQKLEQKKQSSYLTAIWTVFKDYAYPTMHITYDGKKIEEGGTFVLSSNGKYAGGKMKFAPRARTDDQILDLIFVKKSPKFLTMAHLPLLYLGWHTASPIVHTYKAKKIRYNNPELNMQLDGEYYSKAQCNISLSTRKITIMCPA